MKILYALQIMKLLLSLFLIFGLIFPSWQKSTCPMLYRRYSKMHSFCRPPNPRCTILQQGIKDEDKPFILDEHNRLRSKLATGNETRIPMPSATNMLQLDWDEELAAVAQAHANQCSFQHDCAACRRVENFNVGQNLYQHTSDDKSISEANWTTVIEAWYNEVIFFKPESIGPFQPSKITGHFTQVVWDTSRRVGCGYSVFVIDSDKDKHKHLYVCNYGPTGNIQSGKLYTTGPICSKCPEKTCCGNCPNATVNHPGLCKVLNPEDPFTWPESAADSLICDFGNDTQPCNYTDTPTGTFEVRKTLLGYYLSTVLEGGKEAIVLLAPIINIPKAPGCLYFYYRKGPNAFGSKSRNRLEIILTVPQLVQNVSSPIKKDSRTWKPFKLTMNWKEETQISMKFSAEKDAPPQYLDMRSFRLKNGKC